MNGKSAILFSIVSAFLILSLPAVGAVEERHLDRSKPFYVVTDCICCESEMNESILFSIIFFTLALLCYTTGLILEKRAGMMKGWIALVYWLGLMFEICGAIPMFKRSSGNVTLHGIVGAVGLFLIIMHNIVALIAILKGSEMVLEMFPVFSTIVYVIWVIAFITGMIIGMKSGMEESGKRWVPCAAV